MLISLVYFIAQTVNLRACEKLRLQSPLILNAVSDGDYTRGKVLIW